MTPARTYSVVLPDGQTATRRSSRPFTHALIRRNRGDSRYFVSYATSRARADAEARVMVASRDYIAVLPFDDEGWARP